MSADLSKLIPVSLQPIGGQEANAVSARALYSQLGLADSQWSRWFPKNILNNEFAEEHKDWEGLDIMSSANSANPKSRPQETKDFFLAVPFAKKLAMKAHTPEGERVRDYFLACEQVAITPRATPVFHIPQTRAEALRYAADLEDQCVTLSCTVQAQAEDIKVLEPMAAAGHAITQAQDVQSFDVVAKVLGTGPTRLFRLLRDWGWIKPYSTLPFQDQVESGNLVVRDIFYKDRHGVDRIHYKTFITGKGLVAIQKRIAAESPSTLIRPQHRV